MSVFVKVIWQGISGSATLPATTFSGEYVTTMGNRTGLGREVAIT